MKLLQQEDTWQQRQQAAEQRIQTLEQTEPSFANPCVVVNPYQIAPLTAMVLFQTEVSTTVQVTLYAAAGAVDVQYTIPACKQHRVAVYGLLAGQVNHVQLQLEDGQRTQLQITTEALPQNLAQGVVEGSLPAQAWMFVVPVAGCGLPAAYDQTGTCRWYCTEELAFQLSLAQNGHLLTCGPALLSPPYSATAIWEMDVLGKIVREYRIPGGVCNGFFEMADGSLLALHQFFNRGTAADLCVQIDRNSGKTLREWDLRSLLPMAKGGSTSQTGSDWFHASSVCYDGETNAILITGSHQDIIVSLDFASGSINWLLGDPTGWPEDLVAQYFLKPTQDDFQWAYEAGYVQALAGGKLLCFDNGHLRAKKQETPLPKEQRYSRVVCYQVDDAAKTVTELWAYGQAHGNQLYSPYLSNCWMDADGSCLMNFGGIGVLTGEVAEPPAFFVQQDNPEVEMQTVILLQEQNSITYRLQLPVNCYFANKICIAEVAVADEANEGCVLGHWHGNDAYDLELDWEDSGEIPAAYHITIKLTAEQLLLSGVFQQGEMVLLLLEGAERRSYYMQTTRAPYLTASRQTYAKGSDRPITYAVQLADLAGQYEICIGIDDKKYHTGFCLQV